MNSPNSESDGSNNLDDPCNLCGIVEADHHTEVQNEDGVLIEAALCHGCYDKGVRNIRGEEVEWDDELRLAGDDR